MKFMKFYEDKFNLESNDEVFNYLLNTTKDTINGWDYYVNWNKVIENTNKIEVQLNILNVLIGKENIELELKKLLENYSEIISVIPIIIASREKTFNILEPIDKLNENIFISKKFDFSRKITKNQKLNEKEIDSIIEFLSKVGFLDIFKNKHIKNLVDYTLGVEVGLDTNARKNRTGTTMESVCELLVRNMCKKNNWQYISQATVKKIYDEWKIKVPTNKSSRKYDFVINNSEKIFLIEVNYFNSKGSKLKSVSGEFSKLNKFLTDNGFTFCWITDGLGWQYEKAPLREAFENMEYIFNLNMVENGILENIITIK